MAKDNMIKSRPANKNDKVNLTAMSIEQIVEIGNKERDNIKNMPMKTVVTSYAERKLLLSTDLDLGVSIKVENGGRPEEDMTK